MPDVPTLIFDHPSVRAVCVLNSCIVWLHAAEFFGPVLEIKPVHLELLVASVCYNKLCIMRSRTIKTFRIAVIFAHVTRLLEGALACFKACDRAFA